MIPRSRRLAAALAVSFLLSAARCGGEEQHLGRWSGSVVYRGASTPALLDIRPDAESETIRVSLPEVSIFDVPVRQVARTADLLELRVEQPAALRFVARFDRSDLTGTVTTPSGAAAAVRLHRNGMPPPVPVREEAVRIPGESRAFGGTLILPAAPAGMRPW